MLLSAAVTAGLRLHLVLTWRQGAIAAWVQRGSLSHLQLLQGSILPIQVEEIGASFKKVHHAVSGPLCLLELGGNLKNTPRNNPDGI